MESTSLQLLQRLVARDLPAVVGRAPEQKQPVVAREVGLTGIDEILRRSSLLVPSVQDVPGEAAQRHGPRLQRLGPHVGHARARRRDPRGTVEFKPSFPGRRQDVDTQGRTHEGTQLAGSDFLKVARARAFPPQLPPAPEEEEPLAARPIRLSAGHAIIELPALGVQCVQTRAEEASKRDCSQRGLQRPQAVHPGSRPLDPFVSVPFLPTFHELWHQYVEVRGRSYEARDVSLLDLLEVACHSALPPGLLLAEVEDMFAVRGPIGLAIVHDVFGPLLLDEGDVVGDPLEASQSQSPNRSILLLSDCQGFAVRGHRVPRVHGERTGEALDGLPEEAQLEVRLGPVGHDGRVVGFHTQRAVVVRKRALEVSQISFGLGATYECRHIGRSRRKHGIPVLDRLRLAGPFERVPLRRLDVASGARGAGAGRGTGAVRSAGGGPGLDGTSAQIQRVVDAAAPIFVGLIAFLLLLLILPRRRPGRPECTLQGPAFLFRISQRAGLVLGTAPRSRLLHGAVWRLKPPSARRLARLIDRHLGHACLAQPFVALLVFLLLILLL
mmetsp:Transcript_33116/g.85396  ORF Transcript_33116/g.85396 Transcript_33116/m.85396 type:complete len:554 (-) Transcript_33116:514-2175(-)